MKHTFLFDESFVAAFTAGNKGAVEIMENIIVNCHRVVFSADLFSKYWDVRGKVSKMRNDPARYLSLLSHTSNKRDDRNDPPEIPEEKSVHHQKGLDPFLLRYAANGGAFIILEDQQTRNNINKVGAKLNVRAVNIDEAVSLASER